MPVNKLAYQGGQDTCLPALYDARRQVHFYQPILYSKVKAVNAIAMAMNDTYCWITAMT